MSDDFDFISSLRPPAEDPIPEVVTSEREHLMNFIASQNPKRARRRTAAIVAAIGVSTLGLTGIAAAARLLPAAVTDRFGAFEERDGSIEIDTDSAVIASSDTERSNTIEIWVAQSDDGQKECVYVRSQWLRSDGEGTAENGPVACDTELLPWQDPAFVASEPADYLGSLDVFAVGTSEDAFGSTAVTGAAHPSVSSLLLDLQDGQQVTVDINVTSGWFAVLIPGDFTVADSRGIPSNPVRRVTVLDADNLVLAELDDWPHYRAQAESE